MSAQTVRITDLNQEKNERVHACNFTIRGVCFWALKKNMALLTQTLKICFVAYLGTSCLSLPNSQIAVTLPTLKRGKNRIKAFLIELILIHFHSCFV